MVFICISQKTKDGEHFLICVLGIYKFLEKYLFESFAQFLFLDCGCVLLLNCRSYFCNRLQILGLMLNLLISLGKVAILTILGLLVHETEAGFFFFFFKVQLSLF